MKKFFKKLFKKKRENYAGNLNRDQIAELIDPFPSIYPEIQITSIEFNLDRNEIIIDVVQFQRHSCKHAEIDGEVIFFLMGQYHKREAKFICRDTEYDDKNIVIGGKIKDITLDNNGKIILSIYDPKNSKKVMEIKCSKISVSDYKISEWELSQKNPAI